MKLESVKNRVLSIGKLLSVSSIIGTITTYVSAVLVYIGDHSGTGIDLWWLSAISSFVFNACIYVCVFVLPVIFVLGIILEVIIALKNHNAKETPDLRLLVILMGILLTLGHGWWWHLLPEFFGVGSL